jgi:hypothetical protein
MPRTRAYFFFLFAQRAFCASEIRLRPAAESLPRLVRLAPIFAPFSNASIKCSTFANSVINMRCRFRSACSNLVTMSTFPPICDWECANSLTARALLREPMKPAASGATLHASLAGWAGNMGSYLYVAFVRTIKSRCGVKSTMELNAGPLSGLDLDASRTAALTLSRPSALPVM